jgi:vancomycin permeability regulator SanA
LHSRARGRTLWGVADSDPIPGSIPGFVVILGSPNDAAGTLSEMGQGRVELGRQTYLARRDQGWRLLLTGGFGAHFNTTALPHAYHARAVLLAAGVPSDHIVEFAESANTVDDALKARPIVDRYGVPRLIVVSSDFHLARASFIFSEVFPDKHLQFLGAPYLATRPPDERERLQAHEQRELASLREKRTSIVGGALSLDAWRPRQAKS